MSPFDRSTARIIAGVLVKERAARTGHPVNYEDAGIMDLAEEIMAELQAMNGSRNPLNPTVIFPNGALGHTDNDGTRIELVLA